MRQSSRKPPRRGNAVQPRLESGRRAVRLRPMKLLSRFLAVGALLTAVQTFAADTFEGRVSLAITADKGRAMDMDLAMKGQKQRMDMNAEGRQVASIMDMGKMEMLILMSEQQMYMVMPMTIYICSVKIGRASCRERV